MSASGPSGPLVFFNYSFFFPTYVIRFLLFSPKLFLLFIYFVIKGHLKACLCIWKTHKQVLLQTVKIQMKCRIMRHFFRVFTVKIKKTIFCKNYHPTTLDMYNGLSQVIVHLYHTRRKNLLVYKGFTLISF